MNCEQARTMLEQLTIDGRAAVSPEAESHLAGCAACQQWYMEELQAISALDALDPVPVPPDFTARVLSRLPDAVPAWSVAAAPTRPAPKPRRPPWWADLWASLQSGWTGLTTRRRLAPALAVAISLILVLGLWLGLQEEYPPVTPGAATGNALWLIGGLLGLGALVLIIVALARRR